MQRAQIHESFDSLFWPLDPAGHSNEVCRLGSPHFDRY